MLVLESLVVLRSSITLFSEAFHYRCRSDLMKVAECQWTASDFLQVSRELGDTSSPETENICGMSSDLYRLGTRELCGVGTTGERGCKAMLEMQGST